MTKDDTSDYEPSVPKLEIRLRRALRDGDVETVRALIRDGADARYKRKHGYDALIDAANGRNAFRSLPRPTLLELLATLVEHGVDLDGVSSYGESGLRILSRRGRFDGVRFLLEAGADRGHLQWTPLMESVALGSLTEVRDELDRGASLEARDWWDRTPWLLALLAGDIPKAELLRSRGADTAACGRCGRPPLFYPIQGHQPQMLRWLLEQGMDVHQTDEFGATTLMEAVDEDDIECLEILLDAGAIVEIDVNGTALEHARSRDIIVRLLEAGADPADADARVLLGLPEATGELPFEVTLDGLRGTHTRSFGTSNPERMQVPFWVAMIECGAYSARRFLEVEGISIAEPTWSASRYGQSLTLLPDGRAVQIGGEHEDFYDPDFCIYNDVFVFDVARSVEIYGYPESTFPPTDFHTATLVDESIYVIGSLGYQGTRRFGETPVYRLDLATLRIDRVQTSGESPGWIFEHRASAEPSLGIRVWGGTLATASEGVESHDANLGTFVLDLDTFEWRRV